MRARVLLVAGALGAASFVAPAEAAVPGCLGLNIVDPWRLDRDPGPHWVQASAWWANYCSDPYSVSIHIQTKVCGFWGCTWRNMDKGSAHGWTFEGESAWIDADATCREGTHRYRLNFWIYNQDAWNAAIVHEGNSNAPEITCVDAVPPVDVECPKYAEQACRDIDPG